MVKSSALVSTSLVYFTYVPCEGYILLRNELQRQPSYCQGRSSVASSSTKKQIFSLSTPSISTLSLNPSVRDFGSFSNVVNGTFDFNIFVREISGIKTRLDKMEKTIATINTGGQSLKAKSNVGSFMDAIIAPTIPINAKTVEIFSIITFFWIGAIIGRSLLDRLWLLGGIAGAWWASGVSKQDTKNGVFVRRLGAQVALVVSEIQEKYNQAIIFYRTGKLAYVSSKTWEQYDQRLQLTKRFNAVKKLAMERASSFNTAVSDKNFYTPLKDIWTVAVTAPTQEMDRKFRVTSTVSRVSSELYSQSKNTLSRLLFLDEDRSRRKSSTSKPYKSSYYLFGSSSSSVKRKSKDDDLSDVITNFFRRLSISIKNALNILMDREPVDAEKPQKNFWMLPTAPKPAKKFTLWEKLIAGMFLLCIFEGSKKFLRVALKTVLA